MLCLQVTRSYTYPKICSYSLNQKSKYCIDDFWLPCHRCGLNSPAMDFVIDCPMVWHPQHKGPFHFAGRMMTIGISADDAHSVHGLQEGRLSRWYDGCQLNNHSGLPPLSIALSVTVAPVFLYVLRYPIYPTKFYSPSTLFHLFNRERRILYRRICSLRQLGERSRKNRRACCQNVDGMSPSALYVAMQHNIKTSLYNLVITFLLLGYGEMRREANCYALIILNCKQ